MDQVHGPEAPTTTVNGVSSSLKTKQNMPCYINPCEKFLCPEMVLACCWGLP